MWGKHHSTHSIQQIQLNLWLMPHTYQVLVPNCISKVNLHWLFLTLYIHFLQHVNRARIVFQRSAGRLHQLEQRDEESVDNKISNGPDTFRVGLRGALKLLDHPERAKCEICRLSNRDRMAICGLRNIWRFCRMKYLKIWRDRGTSIGYNVMRSAPQSIHFL